MQVIRAAIDSPDSLYDVVSTIAFALGGAQLLQSPETAAELVRLRSELDACQRRYTVDTAALKRRVAELEQPASGTCGRALATGQPCPDHPTDIDADPDPDGPVPFVLVEGATMPVCPVCQNPGCCCTCFGKTPSKDCPHTPERRASMTVYAVQAAARKRRDLTPPPAGFTDTAAHPAPCTYTTSPDCACGPTAVGTVHICPACGSQIVRVDSVTPAGRWVHNREVR